MSSETKLSFSVIIPSYNSTGSLLRTWASVQAARDTDVETVIVDDGSTDDCEALYAEIEAQGVRVVRCGANHGPAHARNVGARETSGEWLVFLDGDDALLPNTFGSWGHAIEPSVGLVEGGHLVGDDPDVHTGFLAGTFAVRRGVFDESGGYDEMLRFSENSELAWRLHELLEHRGRGRRVVGDAVVRISGVGTSRNYDEARMRAAIRLLDVHARRMAADPADRERHEAIAAVNAARIGDWSTAREYAGKAVRTNPRSARNYARLLAYAAHVPPRASSS